MSKTRVFNVVGSLAVSVAILLAIWILVLGGMPTSAAPAAACPTDLFISEYIEGGSYNKAIEIYNGTGGPIDLSTYDIAIFFNGSVNPGSTIDLTGTLAAGQVYVVCDDGSDSSILDECDQADTGSFFNGDDAVALRNSETNVDVIGQIGVDPGSEWGSGDASTQNNTLVRKSSIMAGDATGSDAFDPATEWDGYAQDTFTYLGSHTMDACGAAFSISKSAPAEVEPNQVFTYTLIVQNNTGVTPTTTTITDVVPTGAAFISASDGGSESGGVVTWDIADLADGATVSRTFQVTATAAHGEVIENTTYGVNGGSDWLTTTMGMTRTTTIVDCTSIYGLQYPGGPSLCAGERVEITGTVYAVYYGLDFAIAEASGAWHGIYVNDSTNPPQVGDVVRVQGDVEEDFGFTRISWVTHTVLATGTTPYAASVISTAGAASGEAYEGVLVEVQDVAVSNENPDSPNDHGEWEVDDGSGPVRVDDMEYPYDPTLGQAFDLVRGMLNYSFGDFKIEPRDANDVVQATGTGLVIDKLAPSFVPPGEVFTYTLVFENQTAQTIGDLWISDTLPISLTYARSDPAGTWDDTTHTITWTESTSITHGSTLSYTVVVTAPAAMTVVSNTDYLVSSSDWPTPTVGDPVRTLIRDCNTIHGIQYTTDPGEDGDYPSPCAGENVTVRGVVYAVYGSNYFIAEAAGPWHGLYIYRGGDVSVGDEVEITGEVSEFHGVTEIGFPNLSILSSGNALHGPSLVTAAEIPYDDPDVSEGYEAVFVETRDITVTATGSYGIWAFTDASGGTGKADDWAYTPSPVVSDTFALLRGALAYDYSEYKIMPRDADDALEKGVIVIEKSAPATVDLGGVFTYTLTIANQMGFTLTDVLITDTVPNDTTFADALDGGGEANGVVSWTVSSLAHLDEISVRFVVTAAQSSAVIVNDDYAVSAANHVTPTFGKPVNTAIGKLGIYHLQGEGFVSPYLDQEATVEGIVVADFQGSDEMSGFFMQDPVGDGITMTSDGIFVYATQVVSAGDWIEVTGLVDEYNQMTQIDTVSAITVISTGNTVAPTTVSLPETVNDEMERYEGMLVTIPHTMTVQQNYFQGRFGQVTLGSGDRMYQPTHLHDPGSPAFWDQVDENARRMLVLDDGSSAQNPAPIPYIGEGDTLRAGDVVSAGLTGVLDQGPINTNSPSTKDYRLHPTADVGITRVNERAATPPDVDGRLQVASFNVLNYFTTLDSRGADDPAEFDRQRTKIITAILAIDADVVGLMEIENNGYDTDSAIYDLVEGLNEEAGAGTYAFVDPGVAQIGTDEIAVGLLYKPDSVTPVGSAAILDDTFDPAYRADYNRPALAQTFEENETGERFTAVVNHLKSKGTSCDDIGDSDAGDGQGNCNLTRTRAMTVEVEWLATDPTGSGDPDFLIIGDLNSYAMEDPISVAKDAGYTDLLGAADYTYVFDGQSGYLDHALANPDIYEQVTGAAVWHINADEPSVIDYNTEYKSQDLYAPDAYRSSDHDPVVVGLNLVNQTALTVTKDVTPQVEVQPGGVVTYTVVVRNDGTATARGVVVTDTLPPEVDFGEWVFQGSAQLPPPTTDEIVWGPWDIAAGEAITYIFTAQVETGSLYFDVSVENVAEFDSVNAGSGSSNEATFTTALATAADLTGSTKAVEPTGDVAPGDYLTYTVTLHNSGQAWANVTITDTLPSALLLESGFDGGDALTWSGWVPGGESVVLTLTVQADPDISSETTISNVVTIDDGEHIFDIHSPETTILVAPADLTGSTKAVTPTGDVAPGDYLTYTVTLHNSGQAWANVTITDTLPSALLLESGFDGGDALTWSGWVPGGESVVLTLTVQADPDISSETTISNVVTIDDGEHIFDIHSPETTILPGYHYIYLPLIARNYGP